jgi:hypothetical protein
MNNNSETWSFYCRVRLLPERRSLFQTGIIRLTRSQTSFVFDDEQLNDFELSSDQMSHHAIEIFLYRTGTVKPLYNDVRLASVKYELNQFGENDQIRMSKTLNESDSTLTHVSEPVCSLSSNSIVVLRMSIWVNYFFRCHIYKVLLNCLLLFSKPIVYGHCQLKTNRIRKRALKWPYSIVMVRKSNERKRLFNVHRTVQYSTKNSYLNCVVILPLMSQSKYVSYTNLYRTRNNSARLYSVR